ncbi:MAG: hypothetical protein K0S40_2132 [Actinomycetospora sp.]|nr:hypothetical protein [Actinomycetospora sp.]
MDDNPGSQALGESPAPFGAPETTLPPGWGGGFFETGRPRLGGLERPVTFDGQQTAILLAAADTIIPPHPDWPSASEVGIVAFVGRYVTPTGYRNKHFPFAEEDAFKAGLDALGPAFVAGDLEERIDAIARLEKNEDRLFEQLRALVYYGYYSRPEVVLAIRRNVPAGKDYHGPPLPYGYLETLEPWDEETLAHAGGPGTYLETDAVTRVDLSQLSWTK